MFKLKPVCTAYDMPNRTLYIFCKNIFFRVVTIIQDVGLYRVLLVVIWLHVMRLDKVTAFFLYILIIVCRRIES